jgi:type II secretory pathway component PulF
MRRPLGTVDVVFLCISPALVLALLTLRVLWVPRLALMFRDFGGELPFSTRLVLSSGFAPAVAAAVVLLVALGTWRRWTGLLVAATVVAAGAIAVVFWGMYAPIFALAGAIQ